MVVLCPNCGREIFSDPDYCVMCGWKRGAPQPREKRESRGADYRRQPAPRRPQQARYERRYREPTRREQSPPPRRDQGQMGRPRTLYPRGDDRRYYQRAPEGQRPMERNYTEGYREERGTPPPRTTRIYRQERREQPYQRGYERPPPAQRYDYGMPREPVRETRPAGYGDADRNFCPNCGREILTDPDNCVICGWSRTIDERRQLQRQPRPYNGDRTSDYRREDVRRAPPEGWERRVDERMRGRAPPQREDKLWYKPKTVTESEIRSARDRFICENCGNPSLQFFADGLGRCPGCGHRFRYSTRPTTLRSKQKHKQFVCSKCDSKNLQFFLDGTGLCPHCKREFRWRK